MYLQFTVTFTVVIMLTVTIIDIVTVILIDMAPVSATQTFTLTHCGCRHAFIFTASFIVQSYSLAHF